VLENRSGESGDHITLATLLISSFRTIALGIIGDVSYDMRSKIDWSHEGLMLACPSRVYCRISARVMSTLMKFDTQLNLSESSTQHHVCSLTYEHMNNTTDRIFYTYVGMRRLPGYLMFYRQTNDF